MPSFCSDRARQCLAQEDMGQMQDQLSHKPKMRVYCRRNKIWQKKIVEEIRGHVGIKYRKVVMSSGEWWWNDSYWEVVEVERAV